MSLSSQITGMILEMLGNGGTVEIQRNELAQTVGCVPSQINYVIASRFTPEQGYIVESRRGGGGYIRIRRAAMEPNQKVMHAVNAVGGRLDERTARAHLAELVGAGIAVEKAFQPGGARIRARGVRVESLACIASMDVETGVHFVGE